MRRLPAGRRVAVLLLAAMQLSWTAVAAVVDGAAGDGARSRAPHVEDLGATHAGRMHAHDCTACRAVRTEYVPARADVELPVGAAAVAAAHATREPHIRARNEARHARAPPADLG